jgi:hypothetical protein
VDISIVRRLFCIGKEWSPFLSGEEDKPKLYDPYFFSHKLVEEYAYSRYSCPRLGDHFVGKDKPFHYESCETVHKSCILLLRKWSSRLMQVISSVDIHNVIWWISSLNVYFFPFTKISFSFLYLLILYNPFLPRLFIQVWIFIKTSRTSHQ